MNHVGSHATLSGQSLPSAGQHRQRGRVQTTRGCPLNCHFGSVNLSYRRNLHLDCQAYADFRRQRPDGTKPFTKKDEDQYE